MGEKLVVCGPSSEENNLDLFSSRTGAVQGTPIPLGSTLLATTSLGLHGRFLAASHPSLDFPICVWDLEADTFWVLAGEDGPGACDLEFTSDGFLVSGSQDGIRVWDVENLTSDLLLGGRVREVDVSKDQRLIVAATDSGVFLDDRDTGGITELVESPDRLHALTNPRVYLDPEEADGHRIDYEPFPVWAEVPTW